MENLYSFKPSSSDFHYLSQQHYYYPQSDVVVKQEPLPEPTFLTSPSTTEDDNLTLNTPVDFCSYIKFTSNAHYTPNSGLNFQSYPLETKASTEGTINSSISQSSFYPMTEYNGNTRKRIRKEAHNSVERKRHNNINDNIKHLGQLLPECEKKMSKGVILKESVLYIKCLYNQLDCYKSRLEYLEAQLASLKSTSNIQYRI